MTVLVDTNVLVDLLRGDDRARLALIDLARTGPIHASRLTLIELAIGLRATERGPFDVLQRRLRIIDIDADIGATAQQLAEDWAPSHRAIDPVDYVIAATARVRGLKLVTSNVKHYPMFDGLEAPY